MAQQSSSLNEPVTKKFAPGGWNDLSEPEVKITPADGAVATPADESARSEEATALLDPGSAGQTPSPDQGVADNALGQTQLLADPAGTGQAQGQAAFATLSDTESEDLFQTVYDEQLGEQPLPAEQAAAPKAEDGGQGPPAQADAPSEVRTAGDAIVAAAAVQQADAQKTIVHPEPGEEAEPPVAEPGSQAAPAPPGRVGSRTALRLAGRMRALVAACRALAGLRWSAFGKFAKLSLLGLASITAGVALAGLVMVFVSRADRWQADYLATLSDEKLFRYRVKLEEDADTIDYPLKRQELDKELQRRTRAYAEAYWESVVPQYQQCGRIADQSLHTAWDLFARKYTDLLDTMALLVEEEIRYFGSPAQARSGSLLVGKGMLLEGRAGSLRSIAPADWKDLKLDQVAAVPAQDWLCLRCKVIRERESIPILQGLSGSLYQQHEEMVRKKIKAHKGLRVAALQ